MALKERIIAAIRQTFDVLDDLVQPATLERLSGGQYNTTTLAPEDIMVESELPKVALVKYSEEELQVNSQIKSTDMKAICFIEPGETVSPEADDVLIDYLGRRWMVMDALPEETTGCVTVARVRPTQAG